MQATKFDVGNAPLIDVVIGGDAGVHFASHEADLNLHGLLKCEAVAGHSNVRHEGFLMEPSESR